jgi:hypothetical protein
MTHDRDNNKKGMEQHAPSLLQKMLVLTVLAFLLTAMSLNAYIAARQRGKAVSFPTHRDFVATPAIHLTEYTAYVRNVSVVAVHFWHYSWGSLLGTVLLIFYVALRHGLAIWGYVYHRFYFKWLIDLLPVLSAGFFWFNLLAASGIVHLDTIVPVTLFAFMAIGTLRMFSDVFSLNTQDGNALFPWLLTVQGCAMNLTVLTLAATNYDQANASLGFPASLQAQIIVAFTVSAATIVGAIVLRAVSSRVTFATAELWWILLVSVSVFVSSVTSTTLFNQILNSSVTWITSMSPALPLL